MKDFAKILNHPQYGQLLIYCEDLTGEVPALIIMARTLHSGICSEIIRFTNKNPAAAAVDRDMAFEFMDLEHAAMYAEILFRIDEA